MSHEQSETKPFLGGWGNVTGPLVVKTPGAQPPGTLLAPLFPFEKSVYTTMPEAVSAAERRSEQFGRIVSAIMQRHAEANRMLRRD